MFDEQNDKIDKNGRSRLIVILSGLAVVVVIALILILTSIGSKKPDAETQMARPGSSEYDTYAPFIKITVKPEDKATAKNLLNYIGMLKGEVENTGEQTLVGLQLRAVALGFDQQSLREVVI